MKQRLVFYAAALMTALLSCQPTVVSEFEDVPVVEGFMFSGIPVNVRISKLIPFRDDVSYSSENVDNLMLTVRDVTIGTDYALALQDSGVYVSGDDFLPEAGHAYQLHFTYNGETITAETQIAATPQNVVLSKDEITVQTMGDFQPGGGFPGGGAMQNDSLVVSWDNPDRNYYFVLVETAEDDPAAISGGLGGFGGNRNNARLFRTELTQESSVSIPSMQFGYLGRHLVHVCRLQPEYVTLLQHNSETLTEVFANVEGGFGIFTGIGDCSRELTVVQSEE
jgi:hypothetical protein